MSEDSAPDLDAVRRYLQRFRATRPDGRAAAAVARGAPAKGTVRAARAKPARVNNDDLPKFFAVDEARQRQAAARIMSIVALALFAAATYAALAHRNFVLLPVGSNFVVEVALVIWPGAWPVAVAHDVMAGFGALMAVVALTVGHVELPGDPRLPDTYVWRRQARFAWPHLVPGACLYAGGVVLDFHGHPVLGALLQSPGFALCTAAGAQLWIPIARAFLVVETDWARDGVSNRLSIGGGLRGFRYGTIVIHHSDLLDVRKCATLWEWCFGLASLEVRFRDRMGREQVIVLRALGSAALVQRIEVYLKGPFKAARHELPPNVLSGKPPAC